MLDDDCPTSTSKQQQQLEEDVVKFYTEILNEDDEEVNEILTLTRSIHISYVQGGLGSLPSGFASLDASRPWICFWVLHSLALMRAPLPHAISPDDIVSFLARCQHPQGGYGGGPMHLAHLAPTYAAVSALVTLGGEKALASIDRQKMWQVIAAGLGARCWTAAITIALCIPERRRPLASIIDMRP